MKQTLGIVGLGKMGGNLALQAIDKGYKVVGFSRHFKEHLQQKNLEQVDNLKELISQLPPPRIIFLLLPAGSTVDKTIDEIIPLLTPDDVIADCGKSYWGDSIRRYNRIKDSGVHYIDCGTSGGTDGARNGACFMVGGDTNAVNLIEPILKNLTVDGGYVQGRQALGTM